ncbi:type II toxin-antitoxin system HicA family toxin [Candidatus Palauibacter sp.]|uniref:type II toxin-antitoxin system HicA family toxin n=1 Tax=Candidatus Palauibacter sp. TaxID=3101350 RepID=UPI003B013AD4
MHRRHRRTLATIFDKQTRGNLKWRDVEAMFRSLDAAIHERRGSSVIIELNGEVETVHRPHPRPECGKGLVKRMRSFLERAGVAP